MEFSPKEIINLILLQSKTVVAAQHRIHVQHHPCLFSEQSAIFPSNHIDLWVRGHLNGISSGRKILQN
jgi:hypothetical protein